MTALGPLLHSFFADHLVAEKGLRQASVRSYRDALRLMLRFAADDRGCKITRLILEDFTADRVLRFLRHLEESRRNHARTRNQRLAAVHTFFEYVASRVPEMLDRCERIAAIPMKRTTLPETSFLERDEVRVLLESPPKDRRHALRDRALLLVLYNSGARVQEAADLRVRDLDLDPPARVRLHGKGDKWRTCPLWESTAAMLSSLLDARSTRRDPEAPAFSSVHGRPLTRFGIYRIVCRHAQALEERGTHACRITPHVLRHTTAVHLLESGVEVNVIRGWLGHVSPETTNRYAEITARLKAEALRVCEPPTSGRFPPARMWRDDPTLLKWLASL